MTFLEKIAALPPTESIDLKEFLRDLWLRVCACCPEAAAGELAAETAARIAADATLTSGLAAETAARIAGDASRPVGGKKVLIIGSSTSAGGGWEAGDDPIFGGSGPGGTNGSGSGWLANDLVAAGYTVRNEAVGGTNTTYWLAQINALLNLHTPDIVVLACASSTDSISVSEVNYEAYVANYDELIRRVEQFGAVAVVAPQLPNDGYTAVTLARMQRFHAYLRARRILTWDVISTVGALDGRFLTVTASCGTTSGTTLVTTTKLSLYVGMVVNGAGIPSNSRITAISPGVSVTISAAATATATVTLTFGITLDGTHLSSKALAHRAHYKGFPFSLITRNGARPPALMPRSNGLASHGIQYAGSPDSSRPINIPTMGLDSFSISFRFRNTSPTGSAVLLAFDGPNGNTIRLRGATGSWALMFGASSASITTPVADANTFDGKPHTVTVTYHQLTAQWKLFFDGVQMTTAGTGTIEGDGSYIYRPDVAVSAIVIGNGLGSSYNTFAPAGLRVRDIALHRVPLSDAAARNYAAGIIQEESLELFCRCDDATPLLGGTLQNIAGTTATAVLSTTAAWTPTLDDSQNISPVIPIFANDAAADAAPMPVGKFYRVTGSRAILQKP